MKEEHGAGKAAKLLSQPWDASLGRGAVVGIIKELGPTFKCEREEERWLYFRKKIINFR